MSPLTLGSPARRVPTEFAELLQLLGSRPQPAVVHYSAGPAGGETPHGSRPRAEAAAITPEAVGVPQGTPSSVASEEPERIELSGRVLANWATKMIGLFAEEHDLSPDDTVLVDMQLHWKTAAVVLAAGTMGTEVRLAAPGAPGAETAAKLVVTDRPLEVIDSGALGEAELAAVSPGLLDVSFAEATGQQIPAWVTDVSAEVRQHPDHLLAPLPAVALPDAADAPEDGPLVLTEWGPESYPQMLGTWSSGGVVVLFAGTPGGERWEQMRRNEGLT
ncbi:TIGR03089 family protein [Nesterenkonia muleiensis]|uniref:TIGR03089 family protein n=1 Tax=Nesterenkonia muleiensis TaxID=2282648 RepID=UPI000E735636|nr:TIGR03089 family protein [Nesterenkonia muleiensis]